MIIYLLINQYNGKVYVGQTIHSLERRWNDHIRKAVEGSTFHLHNAIRKYGPHIFESMVLKTCETITSLNDYEKRCIALYRSNDRRFGYNMTTGGECSSRYNSEQEKYYEINAQV